MPNTAPPPGPDGSGAPAGGSEQQTDAAGSDAASGVALEARLENATDAAGPAGASGASDDAELADLRALAPAVVTQVRDWLHRAADVPADDAAERLAGLLRDPAGLTFAVGFVDGVVRPEDVKVAARNLRRLAAGTPRFLPRHLRGALALGGGVAPAAPGVVVPIARRALRDMVGHLVVDATPQRLGKAIAAIAGEGTRLNINLLGEAVLGDAEAARRLEGTIELLRRDDVDYVSIKTSATVAPHQPWAFEAAADEIVEHLLPLYRVAAQSPTRKFINLDMEEYRDLALTIEVFTRILDRDEFVGLEAGIALQAYIPDAHRAMVRLQRWAAGRVEAGGAPIKVRLVKGANLPMERVEAGLRGWPLATFASKEATDTNYKRVLAWALTPQRVHNVRVGVAGHNLFDVAFAWLLARRRGVDAAVDFEMLLGMAQQQAEVVRQDVGGLLLYTPVVRPAEFDVAIAYLVRRLEEGASSENFMSAVFELADDEGLFERERERFLASLDALTPDAPAPRRVQDRAVGAEVAAPSALTRRSFVQTPDSDPSLRTNQRWAEGIRERARDSRLGLETIDANTVADSDELRARIRTALDAGPAWRDRSGAERADVLHRAGDALERRRGELIEIAIAEAGKTIDQADPEVSEAVDFAHYYAELGRDLDDIDGAVATPARLIAVTPPWNFPIAIPAGSTLAALASGASAIVKPSRLAARCGAVMVEALWAAGVPRDALQIVQFADHELQGSLVADPAVDRVVLTGGYETAASLRALRPDLQLLAETSGKNAIVVTPSADYDLAVRDVVASAFGHAGQKCSAASLVVLVGQAGRSKRIRNQLRDAVTSLRVGPPTEAASQVGPVIAPPADKLLTGLTTLGEGERWFVTPRRLDDEGRLWRPGVRMGVRHGSEFQRVEHFGPVLGVMIADTLDEAIEMVNEIDFGLTSGLHSLDPAEIAHWCSSVQAGNLYVNRGTTGAIVQRQPFGGWKKSAVGTTTKVGGPNALVGLVDWAAAPSVVGAEPSFGAVCGLRDAARALAAGGAVGTDVRTGSHGVVGQTGPSNATRRQDAQVAPNLALPARGGVMSRVRAGVVGTSPSATAVGTVTHEEAESVARAVDSDEANWTTEFGVERDIQGLAAERNVFRYLPVPGHVTVRLAERGRVAHLLRVVAAGVRAGARMRVSTGVHLPPAARVAIAAAGVRSVVDADRVFATQAARLPAGRIRLVDGDRAALARAVGGRCDLAIYAQAVTESGRVELLPFLHEQSVSITAHRFGTQNAAMRRVLPGDHEA